MQLSVPSGSGHSSHWPQFLQRNSATTLGFRVLISPWFFVWQLARTSEDWPSKATRRLFEDWLSCVRVRCPCLRFQYAYSIGMLKIRIFFYFKKIPWVNSQMKNSLGVSCTVDLWKRSHGFQFYNKNAIEKYNRYNAMIYHIWNYFYTGIFF
jgi:hypothetical protein